MDVISQRSGLPASEVNAMLSHCDANQTSTNFCAWRDQVVAEQELQRVVDEKSAASPACNEALEKKIEAWKKRRDASCQKSAQRKWGGGSMLPTAVAICATAETKRMTKRIDTRKACR
ncbi:lysozyme inhibitor LprI family protein [Paraburkholderia kururiensis]|uniref:lysozyme inhibitor LprI family protein n=1 Tax=Paraburkholderia TaxID=1822464 RepID=UPI003B9E1039